MTQTLDKIRTVAAELEMLDAIRHSLLHKRSLLVAAAQEEGSEEAIQIALATGVSVARMYTIGRQGSRGLHPLEHRLQDVAPNARLLNSETLDILPKEHASWVAFPLPEDEDE